MAEDKKKAEVKVEEVKIHIDIYLLSIGTKEWEKGGKKAFALKNKKEVATEAEFKELFKKY